MKNFNEFVDAVHDGLDRVEVDAKTWLDLEEHAKLAVEDEIAYDYRYRGVRIEVAPMPNGNLLGMVRVTTDADDESYGDPTFDRVVTLELLPKHAQPAAMASALKDMLEAWSRHLEVMSA